MAAASGNEDGIAIIGMACRLPGDIDSPQGLVDFLTAKRCAIAPIPEDHYPAGTLRPDTQKARLGLLHDDGAQHLDARFFKVADNQVDLMDPQQRMALEVSGCHRTSCHVGWH